MEMPHFLKLYSPKNYIVHPKCEKKSGAIVNALPAITITIFVFVLIRGDIAISFPLLFAVAIN